MEKCEVGDTESIIIWHCSYRHLARTIQKTHEIQKMLKHEIVV
jgi:hypothetical protein